MARRPKSPKPRAVIEAMQAVGEDLHEGRLDRGAAGSYPEFVKMIESRYPVLKQEREWHEWYMQQPYEPRIKVWRVAFVSDRPWASLLLTLAFTAASVYFITNAIQDTHQYWSTGHPVLMALQFLIIAAWVFLPISWWRGLIGQVKAHLDPNTPTNGHVAAAKMAAEAAEQREEGR